MRADRLVATLLQLQALGRVTAAQVATERGVSLSTARRDLEALSTAGIPVYPQPGRGGGWALVGGARTDLSGLSAPETQALFLLMGPTASAPGASPQTTAALRKLVGALPRTFRDDAQAAAGATLVDPAGWGDRDRPQRSALVVDLQTAVVRQRQVSLVYRGAASEPTERLIHPWGLVDKDDVWYLLAGTSRGRRTFRVDRVISAVTTEEPAERPPGFELAQAWREVVGDIEERRSVTWASVLIADRLLPILRDRFGRHCHVMGTADDGRTQVRVAAPTALDLARDLAGWGGDVEVTDPEAVRTNLAKIAADLARLYQPAPVSAPARGREDPAGP